MADAVLLDHARQSGSSWPGQERLAEIRQVTDRTIRNHLADLYWIESVEEVYGLGSKRRKRAAAAVGDGEPTRKLIAGRRVVTRKSISTRQSISDKTDAYKEVSISETDAGTLNVSAASGRPTPNAQRGRGGGGL